MALVRQESAFDEKAVSAAGARGLMQLMPATARQVAKALRISMATDQLTADPAYNLKLGTTYLKDLLDAYDGSYVLARRRFRATWTVAKRGRASRRAVGSTYS